MIGFVFCALCYVEIQGGLRFGQSTVAYRLPKNARGRGVSLVLALVVGFIGVLFGSRCGRVRVVL